MRMKQLHGAIGLSILVEPPPSSYIKSNTHRTTVGAVLNGLHIPSTTLELGPHSVVDPSARDAGLQVSQRGVAWRRALSPLSATCPCCIVQYSPRSGTAGT